ncbi:MAG TPA: hypothetical protein VI461_11115, partial [Chitinophagaceae bacterium]|nr:hypothetical protein [Chitinophagaceae bacterium]
MGKMYEKAVKPGKVLRVPQLFSSLGMVIPFQPSMWDDRSLQSVLSYAIEMAQEKMEGRFSAECIGKVTNRLRKLFAGLNFNTHRKSLAIVLSRDEEKVIYIGYQVKPVVFFSKFISLLDLTANMRQEPSFYIVVFQKHTVRIYEYNIQKLTRVFDQPDETCVNDLFWSANAAINLLNGQHEKPVFVTGSPNLVELFCNDQEYSDIFFPLLYEADPVNQVKTITLAKEISDHWNYWQSKFIAARVLIAKKTNSIISNVEAVVHALGKGLNDLLLIDKRLKRQLQRSLQGNSIIQLSGDLIRNIEKFLANGNRVEIT